MRVRVRVRVRVKVGIKIRLKVDVRVRMEVGGKRRCKEIGEGKSEGHRARHST